MLSCAGLSAGVEPGERGKPLNGETNESGNKGGENKRKEKRGREDERDEKGAKLKDIRREFIFLTSATSIMILAIFDCNSFEFNRNKKILISLFLHNNT